MDNRNKDTESGLRFVNPPGLYNPAPNGYSHLALFPKGWRIILPAGQGGETEDQVIREEFDRVWGDRKPAWTLAPVPALAIEGMLVEIDVIAVVPE